MPIIVACQCGQRFNARDDLAGRRVKCPACGGVIAVPSKAQPKQRGELRLQATVNVNQLLATCACGRRGSVPRHHLYDAVFCDSCGSVLTVHDDGGGAGTFIGAGGPMPARKRLPSWVRKRKRALQTRSMTQMYIVDIVILVIGLGVVGAGLLGLTSDEEGALWLGTGFALFGLLLCGFSVSGFYADVLIGEERKADDQAALARLGVRPRS